MEMDMKSSNDKLDSFRLKNRIYNLRSALLTFEGLAMNIRNSSRRGEYWQKYFDQGSVAETLKKVGFSGNVQSTVKSLFFKLNTAVHESYNFDDEIIVHEDFLLPNEMTLIKALWQLPLLNKGLLKVVTCNK